VYVIMLKTIENILNTVEKIFLQILFVAMTLVVLIAVFNRITVKQDTIIKEGIDDQGRELAQAERAWYQRVEGAAFRSIPKIYSYEPLEMERIHGKNIYEYTNISKTQKNKILESIIRCLKDVHALEDAAADFEKLAQTIDGTSHSIMDYWKFIKPFGGQKRFVDLSRLQMNRLLR